MTLTNEQIERLLDLASKATPGPWRTGTTEPHKARVLRADGEQLAVCTPPWSPTPRTENANYIAHADPTTVASLCTELLALRAEVEWLKRPEVVLAEAERLMDNAEFASDYYYYYYVTVARDDGATVGLGDIWCTLPEAFAKLQEARRGE